MHNMDDFINEFERALLQVNRIAAREVYERCFEEGMDFASLEALVVKTLERIGKGWEDGTVSLSQVYMSGVISEELIGLYSHGKTKAEINQPSMAIGVLQDYHVLGKKIVLSILKAGGYEVLDFGQGLTVEETIQKTIDENIEILLISTLILPSALKVKDVKEGLKLKGFNTKIIVGGAPFRLDRGLWERVGADGSAQIASDIIWIIEGMVGKKDG